MKKWYVFYFVIVPVGYIITITGTVKADTKEMAYLEARSLAPKNTEKIELVGVDI